MIDVSPGGNLKPRAGSKHTGALGAALALMALATLARAETPCDFLYRGRGLCSCDVLATASPADRNNPRFCPPSTAPCQITLPGGFPCPNLPADNPLTMEKIELGRVLFYDTKLSGEGLAGRQGQACASCHRQELAFTDGRAHAVGSTGQVHPRNAMTLANAVYQPVLTHMNPGMKKLEVQAGIPMFGEEPVELGLAGKETQLVAYLTSEPRYARMFREAYPDKSDPIGINERFSGVKNALASFQRTLISGNSPFDRNAHSDAAARGYRLFTDADTHRLECGHCHNGFNFQGATDAQNRPDEQPYHNLGLYNVRCSELGLPPLDLLVCRTPPSAAQCERNPTQLGCFCEGSGPQDIGCYPRPNLGIYADTQKSADMGKFKTPTLRNLAVTGPYMHDGSIESIAAVVQFYADGGAHTPAKSPFMHGFDLTEGERQDLVAFLESLTDEEFLTNPKFADPFLPVACAGDCDLNGGVEVHELVTAISVSLGNSSLALCLSSDLDGNGAVAVNELVRSIGSALNGCPR